MELKYILSPILSFFLIVLQSGFVVEAEPIDIKLFLRNHQSRSVTYDEVQEINSNLPTGSLTLLLITEDRMEQVGLNHRFRSGDKFRFEIESNRNGWLYILHRDPGQEPKLLWPRIKKSDKQITYVDENSMHSKQTYFVPPHPGVFKFDDNVGAEYFYVALSSKKEVPELTTRGIATETAAPSAGDNMEEKRMRITQFAVKSLNYGDMGGYRSVVFDPGPDDSNKKVFFTAHPQEKSPFTLIEFKIQHAD